jgi:glycosyltransferase involved in cell wall biosynthesis
MTVVIHCVAGLAPQSGGPSRTVTYLTDGLSKKDDFSIVLITQSQNGSTVVSAESTSRVDRQIANIKSRMALVAGLPLKNVLKDAIREHRPALLHDHGIWHPTNYHIARIARKYDIPRVIHPRGMLEEWALNHHRWKKQLALRLYQRKDLETASLFFATAEQEADSIRKMGLRQPIAIIPNGVNPVRKLSNELELTNRKEGPRTALFISRIHPKKGLLNLVEAWNRLRPVDWRLCIAGPDEGGHLEKVMKNVRTYGLEESIDYVGEVRGEKKSALYTSSDLFVLPSYSENFGVVVAEALAHSLPVITTRGTPWEGLLHRRCGWWIEPTVDALTETLKEAMSMDATTLKIIGGRGLKYSDEFNWAHIASKTAEVYRWVLGQGPMPACVLNI